MKIIETPDVDRVDDGVTTAKKYVIQCPDCGERMPCTDYGWELVKCKCGYAWQIYILARGVKSDD